MPDRSEVIEVGGHAVTITNPDKVFFPSIGATKMDLVSYYLSVAPGALAGAGDRPMALNRSVNGADAEPFFQKRAPSHLPPSLRPVPLPFATGPTPDAP